MEYRVFNENNCLAIVTDEQLEIAFMQKEELPVKIIAGMGASRAGKYLPRLEEALYYEQKRSRIDAIYSVFSIEETEIVAILQRKERSLPLEDLNNPSSEKVILQSLLIRLEGGPSAVQTAFFDRQASPHIKFRLMFLYSSHFTMLLEDLHFIINALEAIALREEDWIQALKKDDYVDAVIQGVEAVSTAMVRHNLLDELSEEDYCRLAATGKKLLEMRVDSIVNESIAEFSKGLPPSYAYLMLEPIMNGKAKGDVRRELKKSLEILKAKEDKN